MRIAKISLANTDKSNAREFKKAKGLKKKAKAAARWYLGTRNKYTENK
jgi:hypothetical protein